MVNKQTNNNKRGGVKKTSSSPVRTTAKRPARRRRSRRSSGFWSRYPRWAWWLGGIAIVVLYVFLFYHFFVGPTGFRWRALYGDERMAMLKYDINDCRVFYNNDLRGIKTFDRKDSE